MLSANVQTDQLTVAEVEWLDEQPNQPLTKEHDDLAALLEALSMHPMVSALEMGARSMASRSWPASSPICCPSSETRSRCCWR